MMKHAGDRPHGLRARGLIVVLWRAGLRIAEALALTESDLEAAQGAVLVRHGKGGRRRVVGMDEWGWEQLRPWLEFRRGLPVGPLFCAISPPATGAPWSVVRSGNGFADSPLTPASAGGPLHTNFATPMRLRWLEKACR